jgi:hypothetical protein
MINVNQITAQLAKMPDQALQQYAMMHKNDPYTVSLALSESNRRKQMRDAAQGQQGMAPQPKVVDQGIAGMAAPAPQPMPEDVGIGALPAPNMQGMAGGGIVAFGDGGDVQHFQSGGSAFERWLRSNITPVEQKRFESLQEQADREKRIEKLTVPRPLSTVEQAERNRAVVADADFTRGDVRFPAGLALDTPPVPTVKTPAVADAAAGNKKPSAPASGNKPPVAPVVPEKDFLTLQRELEGQYGEAVDPLEAKRAALTAKEKAGEEEGLAKLKADQEAEMKTMFKGREERIGKREAELGKFKDTNTGMALLEAGLAMMQSRGPGLAGIAQGAGVGLKQYQSGIKDIKAAQEKLDDARDRVEELRQNQSSMNKREVRAEEKGIRAIVNQGNRDLFKGLETATGKKEADVRAAVTSAMAVSQADKARATTLEAARIAAEPGLARNKMLAASQSDTAKARTEYGKLQAKVMADLSADPQYTMATDAVKAQMATTRLRAALLNNPFLSAYAAGIGFSAAPAGTGAVRELDED